MWIGLGMMPNDMPGLNFGARRINTHVLRVRLRILCALCVTKKLPLRIRKGSMVPVPL